MKIPITKSSSNETVNIALDTIRIGKQALVFVSTKSSAEKAAEDISKKIEGSNSQLEEISFDALHALSKPTKQCERLARCLKKGIAFHHSGLTSKQRHLVEDNFRKGAVKIICCTPTLAAGLDMPAYRAVIRDLKRFGNHGMDWIPVLEYLQMAGRAGRPKYDTEGQAICVSGTEPEKKEIVSRYILGEPEDIYSKLAVEPALRTYLLSLIATRFVKTKKEIMEFFSRTFWAHQYKDMKRLESIIMRMMRLLEEWEFISMKEDFVSASEIDEDSRINATVLGKRVAELYLDPLTANHLIRSMRNASKEIEPFPLLLMATATLEMRPLLRAGVKDYESVQEKLVRFDGKILFEEPSMYEDDYPDFINAVKTAMFIEEWIEEKDEEYLLEKFKVRPGEIHAKLDVAEWLFYSAVELSKLLSLKDVSREVQKTRMRVQYGAKEELFPLLRFKGIGRVRARRLFAHGIKSVADVKKADASQIGLVIGKKIAEDIKEQASGRQQEDIQHKFTRDE